MATVEVILILVGVAFILVSFFVEEKLSHKDIDRITGMSENELKVIVEKQLKNAESEIDDSIADALSGATELTKRAMERMSNEKIMAINEYSDTVMESMNTTHNEILFLYNMLNDKHVELTDLAEQLKEFSRQMASTKNEMLNHVAEAARELEESVQKLPAVGNADEALRAAVQHEKERVEEEQSGGEQTEHVSYRERILALHQDKVSDVEIARQLGLGLGEVKLIIGLYRGG